MSLTLPLILLGALALLAVAYVLHWRRQERDLEHKIAQAGDNKELILAEMDQAIHQLQHEEEFWRRNSVR